MPSPDHPLQVLLLEDDDEDAMLAREALTAAGGRFHVRHVTTLKEAIAALPEGAEVVLSDLNLPDSAGFATVQALRAASPLPIVVFTGIEDDELARQAFRAGAQDYLVKGQYDASLVSRSIRYAVERRHNELEALAAKEREEELRQRARLDAMKTTFINSAAHELQTPMTPLLVWLHLLQTAPADDSVAHRQETIGKAVRNAQRLEGVIEAILKVSRVQSGLVRLQRAPVDLRAIATRAVASWHERAANAGLALSLEAPAPVPALGDGVRIEEILGHLFANALRFTPRAGRIHVRARIEGASAVIEVEDTGLGIPPEELERIFEPFVQLDVATRQTEAGLGLGLFFARALADQHGGTLKAASGGPGQGARFNLVLPRAKDPV